MIKRVFLTKNIVRKTFKNDNRLLDDMYFMPCSQNLQSIFLF